MLIFEFVPPSFSVLFVTHSIREAVLLSDRVMVMGRSPSKIIAEIKVPFARPRGFAIGETSQFNESCAMLRSQIEIARQGDAEPRD
jgi:NitT/TauT family transport system ATP-binding protein